MNFRLISQRTKDSGGRTHEDLSQRWNTSTKLSRGGSIVEQEPLEDLRELCIVREREASHSNSHLPIDSFFKYFLSMLGLIKYSGVRETVEGHKGDTMTRRERERERGRVRGC